ncbi:FMN-binding negative transcriptional regulator [Sulfurimonas sp.]
MYIQKHFNITEQKQIQAFTKSNPFATLTSNTRSKR